MRRLVAFSPATIWLSSFGLRRLPCRQVVCCETAVVVTVPVSTFAKECLFDATVEVAAVVSSQAVLSFDLTSFNV